MGGLCEDGGNGGGESGWILYISESKTKFLDGLDIFVIICL